VCGVGVSPSDLEPVPTVDVARVRHSPVCPSTKPPFNATGRREGRCLFCQVIVLRMSRLRRPSKSAAMRRPFSASGRRKIGRSIISAAADLVLGRMKSPRDSAPSPSASRRRRGAPDSLKINRYDVVVTTRVPAGSLLSADRAAGAAGAHRIV